MTKASDKNCQGKARMKDELFQVNDGKYLDRKLYKYVKAV